MKLLVVRLSKFNVLVISLEFSDHWNFQNFTFLIEKIISYAINISPTISYS